MKRNWNLDDVLYNGRPRSVITGMGIVCSIGSNIGDFLTSLKKGSNGISFEMPGDNLPLPLGISARITNFSFDARMKEMEKEHPHFVYKARNAAKRSSKSLHCSVVSMMEAWIHAGLDTCPASAEKIGIVVSGSNLSQYANFGAYKKFVDLPEFVSPGYALQFMDTDQVATLSEIFGITGESFTAGGASASGNVGIIKAMQMIELGILDVCIVVGPLTELSDVERMGFYNLGALGGKNFQTHPEKVCRPFDKKHDGFVCGEGSACLVVESLKSAKQRGAKVLAELAGGAIVLDANRLANPNEDGEVRAMMLALERAGVESHEIDYVNAHATSTPMGDITEAKAIKRVLGKESRKIWINSTKSLTGHCLFAAGVVEAVATVLQANEGFVHPNLNLDDPIDDQLLFCTDGSEKAEIDIAMSNSFGFGGMNTSILIKRGVQ
ncbi:beta-ketoacyl synthase N-terminal-like domain-containing protein [Paenibacillus apiarius]|uniref:beta-ketoacyl synthase N-terminal-like domain-containing protein n=1 Tax=Paenibacillus apiarius TaxID=46240 RepID=UPI00197DA182|nr:beta-ketoacyl synthase N-terminal-like domain-containing protein [Paenibacillus apiarius]MBN3526385.1 hypothetical protein [Paenibacillus apiarius]